MKSYLEIQFKGDRTYLHGTDIFNKILSKIEKTTKNPLENIDFTFKKIVANKLYYTLDNPIQDVAVAVIIKYKDAGVLKKVYIYESDIKTIGSYKYPESTIIKKSKLDLSNKSIVLDNKTKFTTIENVVALNKSLLQNLFPKAKGKWYFTRLKLHTNIRDLQPQKIEIKLRKNIGFKLTDSEIFLDTKKVGNIYFTLV